MEARDPGSLGPASDRPAPRRPIGAPPRRPSAPHAPTGLTVYYDARCELCRRCRAWLETERTWVPVRFVSADAASARRHLGDLPWLGTELVVVADDGAAWVGPAAFLTCLWATVRFRPWARRLSGRAFAPLAERFLITVSANRGRLAAALGPTGCDDGTCRHLDGDRPAAPTPRPPAPPWPGPDPTIEVPPTPWAR